MDRTMKVPVEMVSDPASGHAIYKYDTLKEEEIAKAIHFYRLLKEFKEITGLNDLHFHEHVQPQEVSHLALTIPEAAKRLYCSPAKVYDMIRRKQMEGIYFKIGNRTMINAVLLENWILNGGTKGTELEEL